MAKLDMDDGDDFSTEKRFHKVVKKLVKVTRSTFKDNRVLMKALKRQDYEEVALALAAMNDMQYVKAYGAPSDPVLAELADKWHIVTESAKLLDLTWPIVKI